MPCGKIVEPPTTSEEQTNLLHKNTPYRSETTPNLCLSGMKPELSGFEYNKDFMASVKNLNQGEVGKLNP